MLSPDDNVRYSEELADIFRQYNDVNEAVKTLETAVSHSPDYRSLYETLGARYAETGTNDTHVLVNGTKPHFDVLPVVQNGRTVVPLRFISEAFGAKVTWFEEGKVAAITDSELSNKPTPCLSSSVFAKQGVLFLALSGKEPAQVAGSFFIKVY